MKIQIQVSDMEAFARNKLLMDIGKVIDKDILSIFMENTDKNIKSKFGSIFITEDYIVMNINPKCHNELLEVLDTVIPQFIALFKYSKSINEVVKQSIDTFNKKWEVYEDENTNNI